jgi:hypothetical protein
MKNQSTPDWDEWYSETHGGSNKATWEMDDDVDEVDFDKMDDKYEE